MLPGMEKMSFWTMVSKMSTGLGSTCTIFGLTLLFAIPLGMVVAMMRMSKFKPLKLVTQVFISILRGTPLMLQLLAVTYGPFYLFKYRMLIQQKLLAIVIAFSLNYAAYFAEIYRGGIESMPVGQYEAAHVLGYSKAQTFFRIILPQVFKRILPSMTNEIITLVKDTSLASTLAFYEMYHVGREIANNQSSFTPFVIAGIFYYIMNAVVAFIMSRVEKAMNYYR